MIISTELESRILIMSSENSNTEILFKDDIYFYNYGRLTYYVVSLLEKLSDCDVCLFIRFILYGCRLIIFLILIILSLYFKYYDYSNTFLNYLLHL